MLVVTLFSSRVPAKVTCKLYKFLTRSSEPKVVERKFVVVNVRVVSPDEMCKEKVLQVRKKFESLKTKEEKKQFVRRMFSVLKERFPDVPKRKIGVFLSALLSSKVDAKKACLMYKKLLKEKEGKMVKRKSPVRFFCIQRCMRRFLRAMEILRINSECGHGPNAIECIEGKLTDRKSVV